MSKRREHQSEFKGKAALEALKGEEAVSEPNLSGLSVSK